jgi:hypothetical protein
MEKYGRRYVSSYYPPGEDDRGARDEGYYYEFCSPCNKRTEHETGTCLSCAARRSRQNN